MNKIRLSNLELKTFTEQDTLDYCQINNINPDNLIILNISNNRLKYISGIKIFKNLQPLYINNNYLSDISAVQYLTELNELFIENLLLNSDQIQYINKCKSLRFLFCRKGFRDDMNKIKKLLNKNIIIIY